MMVLIRSERFDALHRTDPEFKTIMDFGVPAGTQIVIDDSIPEADENGRPIICFIVKMKELYYLRGEPVYDERGTR